MAQSKKDTDIVSPSMNFEPIKIHEFEN